MHYFYIKIFTTLVIRDKCIYVSDLRYIFTKKKISIPFFFHSGFRSPPRVKRLLSCRNKVSEVFSSITASISLVRAESRAFPPDIALHRFELPEVDSEKRRKRGVRGFAGCAQRRDSTIQWWNGREWKIANNSCSLTRLPSSQL